MKRGIAVLGLVAVGVLGTAAISPAQAQNNTVQVSKVVVGTPPAGTTFTVRVDCFDRNDPNTTHQIENLTFDATGKPSPQNVVSLTHDFCRVTEPNTGGASSTTFALNGGTPVTGGVDVNFSQGEADSCVTPSSHVCAVTVTNTFNPAPTTTTTTTTTTQPVPTPPKIAGVGAAPAAVLQQPQFTG